MCIHPDVRARCIGSIPQQEMLSGGMRIMLCDHITVLVVAVPDILGNASTLTITREISRAAHSTSDYLRTRPLVVQVGTVLGA